jgi:hypothetical protein
LENMDMAVHVNLAIGLSLLSFCKTAVVFIGVGARKAIVNGEIAIDPQFIPLLLFTQADKPLQGKSL